MITRWQSMEFWLSLSGPLSIVGLLLGFWTGINEYRDINRDVVAGMQDQLNVDRDWVSKTKTLQQDFALTTEDVRALLSEKQSVDVLGAGIITKISSIAAETGVSMTRANSLPIRKAESLQFAIVNFEVAGTHQVLLTFLAQIIEREPKLFVEGLQIIVNPTNTSIGSTEQALTAELAISAAVFATKDETVQQ